MKWPSSKSIDTIVFEFAPLQHNMQASLCQSLARTRSARRRARPSRHGRVKTAGGRMHSGILILAMSSGLAAAAPSARPHILMMLADDWSAPPPPPDPPLEMLMGFVGRGSYDASWRMKELGREPDITTKNIDALSADGIRFANCTQPPPPAAAPAGPPAPLAALPLAYRCRWLSAGGADTPPPRRRRLRAADLHADALGAHVGAVLHPHRLRAHPLRYRPSPLLPFRTPQPTLLSRPCPCLPARSSATRNASSAHG